MQPKNREECQFLYKKLIRALDNPVNVDSASYYIRNLNNTISCDQFSNLETLRREMFVIENINKLNNPEFTKQSVIHCRPWHRKALIHSLSYYNRYLYHLTNIKLEFHRIFMKIFYNK